MQFVSREALRASALVVALGALISGVCVLPATAGSALADLELYHPKSNTLVGSNIISPDGSDQTMVLRTDRGVTSNFMVLCRNNGTDVDGMTLTATKAKGFRVTYLFYSGTANITSDVYGAGHVLPDQPPPDAWAVTMKVRARPRAPRLGTWLITGTSTTDDTASDTVMMKVRLPRRPR